MLYIGEISQMMVPNTLTEQSAIHTVVNGRFLMYVRYVIDTITMVIF